MNISEITITSLGDLLDQVTPAQPDPKTGRRRYSGVFRGSAVPGPLLTSLDRLGGVNPPHTKADLEEHLLRNFIRYSRPHLPSPPPSEWELLVTAQHYGLPTRLLDWTYSPLVAAHFATVGIHSDAPSVVWRLDWKRIHTAFGLPELALSLDDLEELFDYDGEFMPWVLFDTDEKRLPPFACMLEPPSLDTRIVSQAAVFTLCTDTSQSFDRFLAQHGLESTLTRFVIPPESVPLLRDQLDMASVDERRLFPDLSGVAAQMRRYYS
ncbi:MAG: hypothetical protein DCC55_02240 [Chloroflexi bacterium]|nr:MAG: hypothetical protein DCC55_02240 [Chloroflexota bacterium]